jgi:hypothetical protein
MDVDDRDRDQDWPRLAPHLPSPPQAARSFFGTNAQRIEHVASLAVTFHVNTMGRAVLHE